MESTIQSFVNTISLCSALITLSAILAIVLYRRQSLNRVTLRFQGIIAVIDVAKHITLFGLAPSQGSICVFIGFFRFFLDHMFIFVNVLVALNTQLLYIHNKLPNAWFEVFYILFASGIAFIIDLIPFAFSAYGKNDQNYCFLKEPLNNRNLFKIFLIYTPIIPALAYCILVFFWVAVSLHRRKNYLDERFPCKNVQILGEAVNGRDFIKKLYFRMSIYPLSSVVGFLPYILVNMYFDINQTDVPDWVLSVFRVCIRSMGFLNLLSLLFDPHFQIAIKSIYTYGFKIEDKTKYRVGLENLGSMKKEDE